jgi:hypothetical protein
MGFYNSFLFSAYVRGTRLSNAVKWRIALLTSGDAAQRSSRLLMPHRQRRPRRIAVAPTTFNPDGLNIHYNAAAVGSSLQLKPRVWQSLLSFHHSANMLPRTIPQANLDKMANRALLCTAKIKYRDFETNIPRKGLSGSQSQYPHSCVCERFIYSQDRSAYSAGGRSAYSAGGNMLTDPRTI